MELFKRNLPWVVSFAFALIIVSGYRFFLSPPANFPSESIVIIPQGTSATLVAKELADAHVIASPTLLELVLRMSGKGDSIQAGAYRFQTPQNLFRIAYRIVVGEFGLPLSRITFVEGITVREAAEQVQETFSTIVADDFLNAGKPYEGYLFPDTYFFSTKADAESIVNTMRENFNTKIASLSTDIQASEHSLSDIVTMASLVEKEARTVPNRRLVAGVLWNRLEQKMPLQVDAVFGYIYNRDTYSPSLSDLKVDSPYNTYIHKGLPPGPICNPGIESIEAVLNPTKTDYLYYLTGSDGVMYYATTYAEHQSNRRKHLN